MGKATGKSSLAGTLVEQFGRMAVKEVSSLAKGSGKSSKHSVDDLWEWSRQRCAR